MIDKQEVVTNVDFVKSKLAEIAEFLDNWVLSIPDEPIPDPEPDPEPTGSLWSNPSNWSDGLPTKETVVHLTNDITIDSGVCQRLYIKSGVTATLIGTLDAYGSVVVEDGGRLEGIEGAINFHVEDDRLFTGAHGHIPSPDDTGLWCMPGGVVNLVGEEMTSWVDAIPLSSDSEVVRNHLTRSISISNSTAKLSQSPIGWRVGDTLLLVSEKGVDTLVTLTDISNDTISFSGGDGFVAHSFQIDDGTTVNSKIANLSRRLQIIACNVIEGDTNHRSHTITLKGGSFTAKNVEFRNLGPRGKLGLYPVHIHHGELATPSMIDGCSIWQDVQDFGNRFAVIHNAEGVVINDCVGYRAQGHGFYMEDQNERNNTITGNLSVLVNGPEELPNVDSFISELPHHFWTRVGNIVSGNVAAGGINSVGFIVLGAKNVSSDGYVLGSNLALGCGKYGLWSAVSNVEFDNPVAIHCGESGFAASGTFYRKSRGIKCHNPIFVENGTDVSSPYKSQIYINSGEVLVDDGWIIGKIIVHTHYDCQFSLSNMRLIGEALIDPTYWECSGLVDNCIVDLIAVTNRTTYPSKRSNPGLLRLQSVDGIIAGVSGVFNEDYTKTEFSNFLGFAGTSTNHTGIGSIQLSELAPNAGSLNILNMPRNTEGKLFEEASFKYVDFNIDLINTDILGWYHRGLPPGNYTMIFRLPDGQIKSTSFIIQSNQITTIDINVI